MSATSPAATSRATSLVSKSAAPDKRAPGILLLPGWDEDPDRVLEQVRQFRELGFICAWLSLPAPHWDPARRYSVTREDNLRDVVRVFNQLAADHSVDRDALGIVGTSYGGYLGALIASAKAVRWLALRSPAIYGDENWREPKEQLDKQDVAAYRRLRLRPGDNKALAACAGFRGDVFLVESEFDHIVPHMVISNYRRAFSGARSLTYQVLSGADHELSQDDWSQAFDLALGRWLRDRCLEWVQS